MSFVKANISLTKGQMKNLKKAIEGNTPLNLRLSASQLKRNTGLIPMLVTKTQLNKLNKSVNQNKGMILKMSKRQIMAMKREGGIIPLLVAGLGALATGALGAVGAFGANKAIEEIEKATSKGKGLQPFGTGTIPIPILKQQGFGHGTICLACNGSGLAPFGTQVGGQVVPPFIPAINSTIPQASQAFLEAVARPQQSVARGSGLFPLGVRGRNE